MRLGVLDIGSNSAHLRVVDAYPGSPPLPVFRHRAVTRLAEAIGGNGTVTHDGVQRLIAAVRETVDTARSQHVAELIPFVTSAVRDAANRDEILHELAVEAGVTVGFLSGEDEGRLTYAADPRGGDHRRRGHGCPRHPRGRDLPLGPARGNPGSAGSARC